MRRQLKCPLKLNKVDKNFQPLEDNPTPYQCKLGLYLFILKENILITLWTFYNGLYQIVISRSCLIVTKDNCCFVYRHISKLPNVSFSTIVAIIGKNTILAQTSHDQVLLASFLTLCYRIIRTIMEEPRATIRYF